MRVIFLGTGGIGLPSLHALAGSEACELMAVVTQPDKPAGRAMKPRASEIKLAAEARGLPVLQPERIREASAVAALQALNPDLFVVMAYGQILPRSVLDIPRLACLNLHASLLPRHRGASPINAAILAGDEETGITVMHMNEGLDTGDILLKAATKIEASETAGELHDRLGLIAAEALMTSLDLLAANTAPRSPQDDSLATYAPKLRREDGQLDWTADATILARKIRAMNPWPGAFTYLSGEPRRLLKIHSAEARTGEGSHEPGTIISAGEDGISVASGGGVLLLQIIQAEGRRAMPAGEYLRGHPLPPGAKFLPVGQ